LKKTESEQPRLEHDLQKWPTLADKIMQKKQKDVLTILISSERNAC